MVPNTSELLPEPETPVNTVSRRFGIWMLMSLRLFSRAPCTRIRSWRSATCSAGDCVSVLVAMVIVSPSEARPFWRGRGNNALATWSAVSWLRSPDGSAQLVDADQVARGIADGAVAYAVRLLGRLLDDFGAGLQPRKGAVEVVGGQGDDGECALGHHLCDGAALVVGDAGVGGRRVQNDGCAGLVGGADRDPAHHAVSDVVSDLEAEGVPIERQGGVRVVVREEARVNGDVHCGHASCGSVTGASRFLTGLVTCFATHGGIPAVARAAQRR